MRLRIRSVKNIAQVTKALETVSASKVRKAVQLYQATRPYAEKAWKVLVHLARQPGHNSLHPLLSERSEVKNVLVLMISSDRGLAGSYNVNILRHTLHEFQSMSYPVSYITVGRKGRDMMVRRRKNVVAEFSNSPAAPSFFDVSAIGRLAVDDYLAGKYDQVYLSYTRFGTMVRQEPVISKLLPLEIIFERAGSKDNKLNTTHKTSGVFTYEPDQEQILSEIVPRFTALQVYQAILSAMASEHAARMLAMHNATDNARELIGDLQLDYNKARQQTITNDILDITGGAEALAQILAN